MVRYWIEEGVPVVYGHQYSNAGGPVSVKRMLMELILSRPLTSGEIVVALDGNELNLEPTNLGLTSKAKKAIESPEVTVPGENLSAEHLDNVIRALKGETLPVFVKIAKAREITRQADLLAKQRYNERKRKRMEVTFS